MLSKRQKKLLVMLRDRAGWCKGGELAGRLGVSARTVRNDVGAILAQHKGLVLSSSEGYRLDPDVPLPEDLFVNDKLAGKEERISYMLSKLLTAKGDIDLYDLADELFVSYQTIEKDARAVEQALARFQLKLEKRAQTARVTGSEHQRRKMLSHLVYSELSDNFHELIRHYRGFYEDVELYAIKRVFCEVLAANNIYINEYATNSIVLHISIAVNRLRGGQVIGDEMFSYPSPDGYREFLLAKQIAAGLERELDVVFPLAEVCILAHNMIGRTRSQITGVTMDNLLEFVDGWYVDLSRALLADVNGAYGLKLCAEEDDAFVRFVFHIRDLVIRMRNRLTVKNVMLKKMKNAYPMIYDISVYMAGKLGERLHETVKEEEIAFLAIHVGAFLENSRRKHNPPEAVRTRLVCPQNLAMRPLIAHSLQMRLGGMLDFVGEDEPEGEVDLILATVPLAGGARRAQEAVTIEPFPDTADFRNIEDAVERIQQRRRQQEFADATLGWFREELFFTDDGCEDEWDAIHLMGRRMQELGYVKDTFTQQVIRREKLSSTTYGGDYAIPHPAEMDSNVNCIAVMVCRKPLKWGQFHVSVVFLIAVSLEQRHSFAEYYDSLASLFSRQEALQRLYGARDYGDFIARLKEIL